jgi:hypothetical protein
VSNLDGANAFGQAVGAVEVALLLGPLVAVGVHFGARLNSRRTLSWMLKFVVACIAIILFPAVIGLRFTAVPANIASVALIWPGWCFCCACGCGAKQRLVRALSWFVAVPSVSLGYLLGTVDCLGVAFVVGDTIGPPIQIQSFETPELACETTLWGGPGAGSGYSIVLYRRWTAVPWLRFRLTAANFDDIGGNQGVSCADLAPPK